MYGLNQTDTINSLLKQSRSIGRSDPKTACALARQAYALCKHPEVAPDTCAQVLRTLSRILYESGQLEESDQAVCALEKLLPACSPVVQAGCRSALGWLAYLKGDNHRALTLTRDALEDQLRYGDVESELWSRNNLAAIYCAFGLHDRAISLYIANRNRSRECGNRLLEGGALLNISMIHNQQEDFPAALQASKESLQLMADGNDDYAIIMIHSQTINALLGLKRYDEALQHSEMLLTLPQPMPLAAALVQFERARVFRHREEWERALAATEAGLCHGPAIGACFGILLAEKAEALEGLGRLNEAARVVEQILADRDLHNRVATLEQAARIAEKRHRYKSAVKYLQESRLFEREQNKRTAENLRILFSVELELEQTKREAESERARSARFAEAAARDGMTGLYNHATFQQLLSEMATREQLALVLLDVDNFKSYNDRFGHPAGDQLLKELAKLMTAHCRQNDILARYGGEEFALLLPQQSVEKVVSQIERLRYAVANHTFSQDGVTISVGVACAPPHPNDPQALVEAADRALYQAKHTGKNRVVLAS